MSFAHHTFNLKNKLLPFHFFPENSKRPCVPKDFLSSTPYFDNDVFNTMVGGDNTVCLPQCLVTEYQMKITKGRIEPEALTRLFDTEHQMKMSKERFEPGTLSRMHNFSEEGLFIEPT